MARETAESNFDPDVSAKAAKIMFESVLEKEKDRWTHQSGLLRKRYKDYNAYLTEQKSKLNGGIEFLKDYDKIYHKELSERLKGLDFINGHKPYVLCLGARQGTEVRAFRDNGCFAVGIDLNPGKENPYVMKGDFHDIDFPENSVDIVFTNSIDHVYRPQKFLGEISRVLKPGGYMVLEIEPRKDTDTQDRWACLGWNDSDDLVNLIERFGLKNISRTEIKSIWFREQMCFQKG
jgi:SAM-dependent methyltransferase